MVDLPRFAAPLPPLSGSKRLWALMDMWFVDHGFIRDIYWNLHQVSPLAWRSAQPAPHHLRRAKKMGIRTVLNLRGRRERCGSYLLEREACAQLGLTLVDFPLRSRAPLDKATLHAIGPLLQTLDAPLLFHCKSGADRAGLMATLYLFLHKQAPLSQAMAQLSIRYGHIKQAKTGIIDYFFETYLAENAKQPMAFFEWVDRCYDPDALKARFRAKRSAGFLVDTLLRRE